MVNGMRDDIWLKKDLNLQKAFADGDFGLLMDYSDENQKNLMNQWMNREASFMNKMLRFGSTVLHRFENGLQNEQQLYAVFRMGALLGTVEGFEQIIYEKAQGEWIYEEFRQEVSSTKHLKEIILALQLYGVMNHSEICKELNLKDSTLTEIMKRIEPTKLVQSTKSGKYKLYTLTDTGRRLGLKLRQQYSGDINLKELLLKLKEYFEYTSNREDFRRQIESVFEENSLATIYSGDELDIFFADENKKTHHDKYQVSSSLWENNENNTNRHVLIANKKVDGLNPFNYENISKENYA